MPVTSWSTTAADNDDADSASGIAFAENQAPGSVNDSMRSLMAVIKGDFAKSHATNGYQKFPNGLIAQWGTSISAVATDFSVTFPTAFPTGCLNVQATVTGGGTAGHTYTAYTDSWAVSTFAIRVRESYSGGDGSGALSVNIAWLAVGY